MIFTKLGISLLIIFGLASSCVNNNNEEHPVLICNGEEGDAVVTPPYRMVETIILVSWRPSLKIELQAPTPNLNIIRIHDDDSTINCRNLPRVRVVNNDNEELCVSI